MVGAARNAKNGCKCGSWGKFAALISMSKCPRVSGRIEFKERNCAANLEKEAEARVTFCNDV